MPSVEILDTSPESVTIRVQSNDAGAVDRAAIILEFLDSFDARELVGAALGENPSNAVAGALSVMSKRATAW